MMNRLSIAVLCLKTLLLLNLIESKPLRFNKDGTFRITQITDLHYGEDSEKDACSTKIQHSILQSEQPDFVVFSGDMVSGWFYNQTSQQQDDGWYATLWAILTSPARTLSIPFATILGNHDDEGDLTRRQIIQLDIDSSKQDHLSHTQQGPPSITGASNYYINILHHNDDTIAARIWLLDSMNNGCEQETEGFGCVGADTVQWMNKTAKKLALEEESSSPVPSLMYVHIPIPEFQQLWDNNSSKPYKGYKSTPPSSSSSSCSHDLRGRKTENVDCPLYNTGLFQVAKEAGITAIYSGHDHSNDYVGVLQGVRLGYGRKTGCGSYGPPKGWKHGARVVELRIHCGDEYSNKGSRRSCSCDPAYGKTWIRQEDGSVEFQSVARKGRWSWELFWVSLCRLVECMGFVLLCIIGFMLMRNKAGLGEWKYVGPGYQAVAKEAMEKMGGRVPNAV